MPRPVRLIAQPAQLQCAQFLISTPGRLFELLCDPLDGDEPDIAGRTLEPMGDTGCFLERPGLMRLIKAVEFVRDSGCELLHNRRGEVTFFVNDEMERL